MRGGRRTWILAALLLSAPAALAAPRSDDARARALRDLQAVAADELHDLLANTAQILPLPATEAAPSLSGQREWDHATRIDVSEVVRVAGLGLAQPRGIYTLCRHDGKLYCLIELPGPRGPSRLLALTQAERPTHQHGSGERDMQSEAGGGEVLGSNFGGAAGHFAEYALTVATPAKPGLIWLRVARGFPDPARWEVVFDGKRIERELAVESTGGWNTFRWVRVELPEIATGAHTLKIVAAHSGANVNFDVVALAGPGFTPPNDRASLDRMTGDAALIEFAKGKARARVELTGSDTLALRVESEGEVSIRALPRFVIGSEEDRSSFAVALPPDALAGNPDWTQGFQVLIPPSGFLSSPIRIGIIPLDLTFECDCVAKTGANQVTLSWRGRDRSERASVALKLRNRGEFRGKFGTEEVGTQDLEVGESQATFNLPATHEGVVGVVTSLAAGDATFCRLSATYIPPARTTISSLRAAVEHLASTFARYDPDHAMRRELEALELASARRSSDARTDIYLDARALAHRALVEQNPLLDSGALLFTRRAPLGGSHYAYTEAVSWARDREWHFRPPSSLCTLSPPRPDGQLSVLLDSPDGVIRDPDVYWDGSKILFSHKLNAADDFHLYQLDRGGGEPRQLTSGPFADYEACYLPGGGIVFNSTRCVQTVPCWITPVSNLYVMDGDGRRIRRASMNQVHDNFPSVLNDGRVVYTRWEYSDRGQLWLQGLFVMNPDGARATALYGNNSYWPISQLHARAVKGTAKIVCTLAGHHTDQSGEIGIFDTRGGTEEAQGCVRIWPARKTEAIRNETYVRGLLTRYQYPYSLSEQFFLVACRPQGRPRYGVYLIDTFGNRELVYEDDRMSCSSPMPLTPREKPPVIPPVVRYSSGEGIVSMTDVYEGPGLEGIPRGTVKALRIIELIFRPFGSRAGLVQTGPAGGTLIMPPMGLDCSWDAKRVVGIAPVHEDGSAMFRAPANAPLCFQPLDENGKALQWMRSWITLMPGEVASCVGCHEPKAQAPPVARQRAYAEGPVALRPWLVSDRAFSFHEDVQPALDRACISCHDQNHAAGIDLRGHKTDAFSLAYEHLRRHVTCPGPQSVPDMIPARSTGAIAGPLIDLLERGHHDVKPSREDMDRLITWIDLNAPYYRSYALTRPDSAFGRNVVGDRAPLMEALGASCLECHREGFDWRRNGYDPKRSVLVDLTRPEESRLLRAPLAGDAGGLGLHEASPFRSRDDPRYRAALEVIRRWADDLVRNPREDMPGARASDAYLTWWKKRAESDRLEAASREALGGEPAASPEGPSVRRGE